MAMVDASEFGAVLPRPQYDVEIAHGFTLKQINGLSVQAAKLCNWVNGMEMTHRAVTTWSAIVEYLQLSYSRPEETELIATGWKEMKTQHYKDLQAHGLGGQDRSVVSKAYTRYWTTESAPTHSHEDRIVDTLAMAQIWPRLTSLQRDVLRALADHDDRDRRPNEEPRRPAEPPRRAVARRSRTRRKNAAPPRSRRPSSRRWSFLGRHEASSRGPPVRQAPPPARRARRPRRRSPAPSGFRPPPVAGWPSTNRRGLRLGEAPPGEFGHGGRLPPDRTRRAASRTARTAPPGGGRPARAGRSALERGLRRSVGAGRETHLEAGIERRH